MAEKGLIEKNTMSAIADAIRTKLESSDLMLPSEMPTLIGTIKGDPTLQSKTVTPSESAQSVTADDGYDGLDAVTVNAIPGEYVKPTATKGATTYTPKTTAQKIAAGTYCSGAQTIAGDANLVAANILSGKSIFGVAGSAVQGAKVETGSFSVTSNTSSKSITHGLGTTPNFAMIIKSDTTQTSSSNNYQTVMAASRDGKNSPAVTSATGFHTGNGRIYGALTQVITWDSSQVTFKASAGSGYGTAYLYGTYKYLIAVL